MPPADPLPLPGPHEALELTSHSPEETAAIAAGLAAALRPALAGGAMVTLRGPLGAGKTALVRGLATALGVPPAAVCSPSFGLVNEYRAGDLTVYHVDAYRLHGPAGLEAIGWDEMLAEPNRLVVVEWPQRVEGVAGLDDPAAVHVTLTPTGPKARRLVVTCGRA